MEDRQQAADHELQTPQAERAMCLAPEIVAHWSGLIQLAAPLVRPGKRPCDYAPWTAALLEAQGLPVPDPVFFDRYAHYEFHGNLRVFVEHASRPDWPEPRRDLIEFALLFLETDVMLFRSGYAKRHLARRLQHAPLTGEDIARIGAVLKRAVTEGAGLEEFGAYARLFASLAIRGHLSDLQAWVTETANGAILTLDRADGPEWRDLFWANDRLSDLDKARLGWVNWTDPPRFGVPWPDLCPLVEAGKRLRDPDQMVRKNAYLMLRALRRRLGGSAMRVATRR